jgi:hypothetical protein
MRRPVADGSAVLAAVAARMDGLERDLATVRDDVTALGRGLADLIAQIRRLTGPTGNTGDGPPAGHTTDGYVVEGSPGEGDGEARPGEGDSAEIVPQEDEGQRDWWAITDPGLAYEWLVEVAGWAQGAPAWYGVDLAGTPCWPLHPVVIGDLLAGAAQRAHAYTAADPTGVSEWLTRWQTAARARIRTDLDECRRDEAHHHDGRLYDATGLNTPTGLRDAATWWATARDVPAPTWLHLPHLT